MGSFSIWHWLIILALVLPAFLPLIIRKPAGGNRYGPEPKPRNFGDAIGICWNNYANFQGRASRSEYWWFYLFVFVIGLIPILGLATLILIIPQLAVTARRLHDINRSGWWVLLWFTGFGIITLIIMLAQPPHQNRQEDVF
mgnify:CR=1 FL=1|jgi:uncharacterized membrane protein YhaH (DUF805 family)